MKQQLTWLFLLLPYLSFSAVLPPSGVETIVQRSVANTDADWGAAPNYDFTERDIVTRHDARTDKTYQVMVINGSPYNKPLAINGELLSPAEAAMQKRKLQQEINRRRNESPAARQKRIAEYESGRRQDHELMTQMVNAFEFKLNGEEIIDGRRCFVLDATPKPGYRASQPRDRGA